MCNTDPIASLAQPIERVIELAISHVTAGGLPFSSVIVNKLGQIIGEGVNQVTSLFDCTAHAEIQAIRNASKNEKSVLLEGATLIASGEPCAMCYMVMLMAKVNRLVILSDRYEAKALGFDYLWTYELINSNSLSQMTVTKLNVARGNLPFKMCKARMESSGL
ncbi:MAG: tRNA-specific adenosine deaminase [Alteromonadaceae bacterium]|uniref:nucleoside deaminase n=1 Tax=uncultured Paraglaciecola sp. TaxID=1765024 RepID=UPI000C661F49|nr:tRNA-specific adenosine deaminase [Alteromonadaceae bacterium]|tara:strand:- start:1398 stop:1886 length:489 start_codon:yes stop_codon:yes gene_type:complete